MIEVELKARVDNKDLLISKLEKLNFIFLKEEFQEDIIFLREDFLDKNGKILDGGIVCRIRIVDGKKVFEIKEIDRRAGGGIEYKIDVSEISAARRIIKKLGFEEFFEMSKKRKYYKYEDFEIALDTIENLGDFLEVELIIEKDSQKQEAKNRCLEIIKKLELENNIENKKYGDLIIEKKKSKKFS